MRPGRLAPVDAIAARAVLQALLRGLTQLAATTGYDDPAAFDELVLLAWERIRTYPGTRCGSVAANVLGGMCASGIAGTVRSRPLAVNPSTVRR